MTDRMIIIFAAFVLDIILGDPHIPVHPVRGIGALINVTEKCLRKIFRINSLPDEQRTKKRIAGALLAAIVIAVSVAVPAAVLFGLERINHYLRMAAEIWFCYRLLAMKSLRTESMKVYSALESGDMELARNAVSMIVGRDTRSLSKEGVTKAAVETVAENTSDGVIAPLIFMFLFGAVGGFFYKAVNTMDSMIGYRNDTYRYFGTAAARLDDIVNFIPARISAWAMMAAAFILKMDFKNALRIFKRDRYNHKSPNSAQTESVCAGALGLELAGDAYYFGQLVHKPRIGDAIRRIEAEDIRRSNRLLYGTGILVLLLGECVLFALYIVRI